MPATPKETFEAQIKEGEWISNELLEWIKLIQQYRILYITAVFVALGWVLGHLLDNEYDFNELRTRPEIALVLSILPLVNGLYGLFLLDANNRIQYLARYRLILGAAIGDSEFPVWRWEIFKGGKSNYVNIWAVLLNPMQVIITIGLSVVALWFGIPAVGGDAAVPLIATVWLFSAVVTVLLIVMTILEGFGYAISNFMTRPVRPNEQWEGLRLNLVTLPPMPTEHPIDHPDQSPDQ